MRPSVPSGWRGTGADSVFVGTRFCTNDGTLLGLQTAIPQRGQRSNWSGTRHGGISVDPIPLADQAGPIQLAALTKNYGGRSNQTSPGSVASAKGLGQHKVADVLRLGARLYTAGLTGLAEIF